MSWPEDRKLIELKQKLSSIEQELTRWQAETSAEGTLPKHNSQVLRVTRQLSAFAQDISAWLAELDQDRTRLLTESRQVEVMILDIHRIWEFFRSKLAQRYVEQFKEYLIAADEFAWACYNLARGAADPALIPPERVKEPPLVFLNGGWSPFAMSRGVAYDAEWVPDEEIAPPQFLQVLKDLPIPVIGVPWYQIQHFPDIVAIGHEVGHNVEEDFGLTERIHALVEAALERRSVPETRREGWRAWAGEFFGDLYGMLTAGPAYVSGLMDYLALSPREIMTARQPNPSWSPHPPDALRIIINLRAIELLGFTKQALALRSAWKSRFPEHAMAEFEADIDPVVCHLLRGPYPQLRGSSLRGVISFGPVEAAQADSVRKSLAQGQSPVAPIRPTVAGARLAFEADPARFVETNADQLVLAAVRAAQTRDVRGEQDVRPLAGLDAAAGRGLFEKLRAAHRGPTASNR